MSGNDSLLPGDDDSALLATTTAAETVGVDSSLFFPEAESVTPRLLQQSSSSSSSAANGDGVVDPASQQGPPVTAAPVTTMNAFENSAVGKSGAAEGADDNSASGSGAGPADVANPGSAAAAGSEEKPVKVAPATRRRSLWERLCLFRKHSSGDLHSRLKTRKLLGVGETDDGEIHRSKISQLLGHNEHLFVKFPRGFSPATRVQILAVFLQGLVLVAVPSRAPQWGFAPPQLADVSAETAVALRLAGAALLALSYVMHNCMRTFELDKAQAKSSLIGLSLCHGLFLAVTVWAGISSGSLFHRRTLAQLGLRLALSALPLGYLHAFNAANAHGHHYFGGSGGGRRSGSFSKDCSSPSFLTKTAPPSPLPTTSVTTTTTCATGGSETPETKKDQ